VDHDLDLANTCAGVCVCSNWTRYYSRSTANIITFLNACTYVLGRDAKRSYEYLLYSYTIRYNAMFVLLIQPFNRILACIRKVLRICVVHIFLNTSTYINPYPKPVGGNIVINS
jgi:hypothetical protein